MQQNRLDAKSAGPVMPGSEQGRKHLASLRVFDRLEVGPIQLEPNKVTASYTLTADGTSETTELIYRYEEDVFDPSDSAAWNLASMMAAQVAMNYGLFCHSIVFRGVFDDNDRRFITDMADNTAREIFVKKFLEPNVFLKKELPKLEPIKLQHYLQAELLFPEPVSSFRRPSWQLWDNQRDNCAILSSGGKDSLLTYGLMDAVGSDVHPIFVNESGRHWFTAVNAYRYFRDLVPRSSRVWVNSDRVFSWMLRRMPFIREDFDDIRSDEYPIRLWTVAVFLFGALPLLRKRKIGRLLVGNEFDTSVISSHRGITHHDGLYDQSIHFDNALSRYFLRKGWAFSQFSVLRPLSELLIQKILVDRFPLLQKQQLSCHAAHEEADRMYPCGKCEKCRRIVAMLTALDGDPERCGYTPEQIERCLNDFAKKGVHQERTGAQHLAFMLADNELVSFTPKERKQLRPSPVVLQLRFDPRRSPINGIPIDLREPLWSICLEHAEGAVRRVRREWEDFDPLTDPALGLPYPFEVDPKGAVSGWPRRAIVSAREDYLWGELTWPEAEERLKRQDIALLPVGSIEQHGPHLPLDTDAFDAEYLACRVAEACSHPKPLVLPLVPYGVSYEHDDFSGTVSVRNDVLSHLIHDIGMSVARNGIKKLVIVNGHGGNNAALNYAAQMITRDAEIFVCVDTGETSDVDIQGIAETPNDVHAGEIETSTSLAVRPQLVHLKEAVPFVPRFSSRYLDFSSRRGVSWHAHTKKISETGVLGDPTKASAEKGRKFLQIMIAHLVALVEDLKSMPLEEIYLRRY